MESAQSLELAHARIQAEAKARLRREKQRRRTVPRNNVGNMEVHTPAALFQTPTPGPTRLRVHTQEEMSSESEGRRDEGAGDDCYASPDPQELALSADREFRAVREDRQSIRDEHRRVKEVRHLVREDKELAFLIAGTLCDGHAACAHLLMEHAVFPSLPPHVQLTCKDVVRGHLQNLMAMIQQLSARVGELEPHVGSVHSLQKQLKQLELEYGAFQRRVNGNLKDKADHLTLVMDQLHIMRTLGTPVDTMKELLERTARDLRAGFQEGLTSLHTALATSGVPSQAASEDEQQGTEEQEEGEAPGMDQPRVQFVPVQQPPSTSEPRPPKDIAAVSGPLSLAKHMPKPAVYSGAEDVDEALFTFEAYLQATCAPESAWPTIATPLLTGAARKAWMTVAMSLQRQGIAASWASFKKSLRDAFAVPNKELHARLQLKNAKQMDKSVVQYVQDVRNLIASIANPPPTEQEQILALYTGLHPDMRLKVAVDPRTGTFWSSFEALATYLISLETAAPKAASRAPVYSPKHTKAKTAKLRTVSASQAKGANKQQQPQQQQPRKQGGSGRNPGGGRGSGGQSKRQRGNGLDPATFARFQQFEQWQKSQGN